ncbi:MAG: putative sugar O-methyltransferase [bacterium]
MQENVKKGYEAIIEYLYNVYYADSYEYSEVTSSHWKEIGGHEAALIDGALNLKGTGFGGLIPGTFINRIVHFPESYLSARMLDAYECPEFIRKKIFEVADKSGRILNYVCVKQALPLKAVLSQLFGNNIPESSPFLEAGIKTVCVIGDGYGCMGSLLKSIEPELKVVSVNLGRTLLFDVYYTRKVLPDLQVGLITGEKSKRDASVSFMEAEKYELLREMPIDLFINIASMQEMNNSVISNYFRYMRSSSSHKKYFYCCNRVEKKLPDGETTRFIDYPWHKDDLILFDEICPWYHKYPTSVPPFWKRFNGLLQHRFVELR